MIRVVFCFKALCITIVVCSHLTPTLYRGAAAVATIACGDDQPVICVVFRNRGPRKAANTSVVAQTD